MREIYTYKDFTRDKLMLALHYYNLVDMEVFVFKHTRFRVNFKEATLQMYTNTWIDVLSSTSDFLTGFWVISKEELSQ